MATCNEKMKNELFKEVEELKMKMSKQEAEITSLKNGQKVVNIPLNVPNNEMNQPPMSFPGSQQYNARINVIIEGLREEDNEDLLAKVMSLCSKAEVTVEASEITFVSRLKRKVPIGKNPNPAKVTFINQSSKERVMRAKYNLKKIEETQDIWLNHDEPTHIRRLKGRARFIASYARKKGSSAQLTPSGIILDDVYYNYDNLSQIPSIYIPPKNLIILPRHDKHNQLAEPMECTIQSQTDRDGR